MIVQWVRWEAQVQEAFLTAIIHEDFILIRDEERTHTHGNMTLAEQGVMDCGSMFLLGDNSLSEALVCKLVVNNTRCDECARQAEPSTLGIGVMQ